ncbi:hypothetical protein EIN_410040 [Entamoeba invadens IP1]|uniref:Uncharacterized protein n=1 Tax=Entamoeba invadens IP1 TaxID=370355 RepID=A0A0A1TZR7_ENTIV|nr:hypothetical protein EIN_410040 [Entamoeba invadens IP1]ELP85685.1 hypothetical protein EIN_410040 [Entamoeba invadens IP1]|eukprot:XP_004185031.1 hypothetical protein EIN_410040 [Entamoeba invadens IP1]
MEIFANQAIKWNSFKTVRRTVLIRATLAQMNCMQGVTANIIGQGKFTVLRWGECKRHNSGSTTRRLNTFQVFMFGKPVWVAENLVENPTHVEKVIYASCTVGLYRIHYTNDFVPSTRKVSQTTLKSTNPNDSTKICSSPSLPSINTFHGLVPQIDTQWVVNSNPHNDTVQKQTTTLPKLSDLFL